MGSSNPRPRGMTIEEAFAWFMPGQPPQDECWDWTGPRQSAGYGMVTSTRQRNEDRVLAHVLSHRIHIGPVSKGMEVLHSCDRPICVNPLHLRVATHAENQKEMSVRGRVARGERAPHAKLTEDAVLWLRQSALSHKEAAEVLGVSKSTVKNARRGTTWGWLS